MEVLGGMVEEGSENMLNKNLDIHQHIIEAYTRIWGPGHAKGENWESIARKRGDWKKSSVV